MRSWSPIWTASWTRRRARIERRLSADGECRSRLQRLQQTWDLLDFLPRASIEEKFAQSTVEMVAIAAASEVEDVEARSSRKRPFRWGALVVGVAAAAWFGYLLVADLTYRSSERLLKDLPVIEDVDLYRNTVSIEFLRELDREGLFAEEVEDAL